MRARPPVARLHDRHHVVVDRVAGGGGRIGGDGSVVDGSVVLVVVDRSHLGPLALDGDAFIEAFYIQILGRRADPAGLDHHRALIANGMTKEDMLRAIMDSPEFKDRRATITVIGADRLDKKAKRRRKLLSLG